MLEHLRLTSDSTMYDKVFNYLTPKEYVNVSDPPYNNPICRADNLNSGFHPFVSGLK